MNNEGLFNAGAIVNADVTNTGIFSVGSISNLASAGQPLTFAKTTLTGNFIQASPGVLVIDADSDSRQSDVLINGNATLGGTLKINAASVLPAVGSRCTPGDGCPHRSKTSAAEDSDGYR